MKDICHGRRASNKKLIYGLLTFVLSLGTSHAAPSSFALPAAIPNASDAGLAQKNLRLNLAAPPKKTYGTIAPTSVPTHPFPQGNKIHLKLSKVVFKGNTVFTTNELEAIFAPDINKSISLTELEDKVEDVTKKYRAAGYVLSRAFLPPQEIKKGVVKIQIVEGYVDTIKIEGNPGVGRSVLEAYGKHVLASRPLQIKVLEHEMLLTNDIHGYSVKAVLTPSTSESGAADLTLVTERKVVTGYVNYDNYGTRYLGPLETSFGASLNSVLLPGDSNAFNFSVTSNNKEMQYGEFVHSQPVGSYGLVFTIGTNYTLTQPEFTLEPLQITGRSTSIYSNLVYPVIRARDQNLFIRGAANYQNVDSNALGVPLYQDRIRSLTFGASYNTSDRWNGSDNLDAAIARGFEIWGADPHFFQSRPKGDPGYTKTTLVASRLQQLTSHLSFLTAIQGQYAFNPLLATEQFSFGGPIYGRGYGPSEIVADRGLAGKIEIHWDSVPEFRLLQSIEYYIFYDVGVLWNIDRIAQQGRLDATSTGIGARFNFIPQVSGEFYIAKPLTRFASTLTPIDQNGNQARGFFQLSVRF